MTPIQNLGTILGQSKSEDAKLILIVKRKDNGKQMPKEGHNSEWMLPNCFCLCANSTFKIWCACICSIITYLLQVSSHSPLLRLTNYYMPLLYLVRFFSVRTPHNSFRNIKYFKQPFRPPNLHKSARTTSASKIPAPTSSKVCLIKGPSTVHHNSQHMLAITCTLSPIIPTYSRYSSTLDQVIPVKDGVGISRCNVDFFKQGESYGIDLSISGFNLMYLISGQAVTFGSIENSLTPISPVDNNPHCQTRGCKVLLLL